MERHVGLWKCEDIADSCCNVGELIINGNSVAFNSRLNENSCIFVGNDSEYNYKVVTERERISATDSILDNAQSFTVKYALRSSFALPKGEIIDNISFVKFTFPELVEWIGHDTVSYNYENGKVTAFETALEPIRIHEGNPEIILCFDSKTLESIMKNKGVITVGNVPYICMFFSDAINIFTVLDEILCFSRFFSLLCGKVSIIQGVQIICSETQILNDVYFNYDFSYDTWKREEYARPRTYLETVHDNLAEYYTNWHNFYFNNTYYELIDMYFFANGSGNKYRNELFLQYMRILDGYQERISGTVEKKTELRKALKSCTKEIKKLLFTEDGKPLFEKAFQTIDPTWTANTKHIGDIAGIIANGYLNLTALSTRLKEIDETNLGILKLNAPNIMWKLKDSDTSIDNNSLYDKYLRALNDTRNYFAHYKLETDGNLSLEQIDASIIALKAVINAILLNHMGMPTDLIRMILAFDPELFNATKGLRHDNDRPLTPQGDPKIPHYSDFLPKDN